MNLEHTEEGRYELRARTERNVVETEHHKTASTRAKKKLGEIPAFERILKTPELVSLCLSSLGRPDLARCMRVNQVFYDTASPKLYSDLGLDFTNGTPAVLCGWRNIGDRNKKLALLRHARFVVVVGAQHILPRLLPHLIRLTQVHSYLIRFSPNQNDGEERRSPIPPLLFRLPMSALTLADDFLSVKTNMLTSPLIEQCTARFLNFSTLYMDELLDFEVDEFETEMGEIELPFSIYWITIKPIPADQDGRVHLGRILGIIYKHSRSASVFHFGYEKDPASEAPEERKEEAEKTEDIYKERWDEFKTTIRSTFAEIEDPGERLDWEN